MTQSVPASSYEQCIKFNMATESGYPDPVSLLKSCITIRLSA